MYTDTKRSSWLLQGAEPIFCNLAKLDMVFFFISYGNYFCHLLWEKFCYSTPIINVYILAFVKARREILTKGIQIAKYFKLQAAKIIAIAIWQNVAMLIFARIKKRSSKGRMREVREWKKRCFSLKYVQLVDNISALDGF